MGRTFRHISPKFESDRTSERAGKHPKHTVSRKLGGMKIINAALEEDLDGSVYDELDELQLERGFDYNDAIKFYDFHDDDYRTSPTNLFCSNPETDNPTA